MKKRIALTFDDGPSPYTDMLLDTLKEYGASATFFLLGKEIDNKRNTVKRISDEGHEIGNHTYSHSPLTYLTDENIKNEIYRTSESICSVTGSTPTLVRPPFGDFDDRVGGIGMEMDVSFIAWSLDTADWRLLDCDGVYNEIINNIHDGDIVLCHDTHETTVEAVKKALPVLLDMGFELVTVTELLSSPLILGKIYHRHEDLYEN